MSSSSSSRSNPESCWMSTQAKPVHKPISTSEPSEACPQVSLTSSVEPASRQSMHTPSVASYHIPFQSSTPHQPKTPSIHPSSFLPHPTSLIEPRPHSTVNNIPRANSTLPPPPQHPRHIQPHHRPLNLQAPAGNQPPARRPRVRDINASPAVRPGSLVVLGAVL